MRPRFKPWNVRARLMQDPLLAATSVLVSCKICHSLRQARSFGARSAASSIKRPRLMQNSECRKFKWPCTIGIGAGQSSRHGMAGGGRVRPQRLIASLQSPLQRRNRQLSPCDSDCKAAPLSNVFLYLLYFPVPRTALSRGVSVNVDHYS